MRPRKQILVVSSDEDRLAVLCCVLRTYCYGVTAAATYDEAEEQLCAGWFDLLICDLPLPGINELLEIFDLAHPLAHSMVMGAKSGDTLCADAIFTYIPSPAEMLERIKVITARKRGPVPIKKPPERVPVIIAPAGMLILNRTEGVA